MGGEAFWQPLAPANEITVRKNSGADVGTRPRLNFIEGTDVTITVADDAASDEVDITIAASAGGGGGGSALLAIMSYRPGTDATMSTTSTSFVDADATNLAVTFTAPASGNVLIRLVCQAFNSTDGANYFWALREGAANVASTSGFITNESRVNRLSHSIYVTGLTGGNSYTYKWAHRVTSGTGNIQVGPDRGPAVMEVWSA